jgi:hypothetical protein
VRRRIGQQGEDGGLRIGVVHPLRSFRRSYGSLSAAALALTWLKAKRPFPPIVKIG